MNENLWERNAPWVNIIINTAVNNKKQKKKKQIFHLTQTQDMCILNKKLKISSEHKLFGYSYQFLWDLQLYKHAHFMHLILNI